MAQIIEETENLSSSLPPESVYPNYQPQTDFYFCSAGRQMLVKPPFANLLRGHRAGVAEQVEQSLRFAQDLGLNHPVVVGAVPFEIGQEPTLMLSSNVLHGHSHSPTRLDASSLALGNYCLSNIPPKEAFVDAVQRAKQLFAEGALDKVVLSRALEVECEQAPDLKVLVQNLEVSNPNAYTFAVPLAGDGAAFVGASPELLMAKKGSRVIAHPLAGSEPRSADKTIDRQRAERLLASSKDRYEHDLVVKAIDKALRPFCRWLHVPKEPSLLSTATLWHLATRIEGELFDPKASSIRLALALHPTPAVGGHPQRRATEAVRELEGYERGLYTGMVGWCDGAGDGEWAVAIRCAEVRARRIRLFAGAGIVGDSIAEKELAETEAKLNTMLNAIGVKNPTAEVWEGDHGSC